jgi:hypothetical protein
MIGNYTSNLLKSLLNFIKAFAQLLKLQIREIFNLF